MNAVITWLSRRPEPVQMAVVITLALVLAPALILAAPVAVVWSTRQLDTAGVRIVWRGRSYRPASLHGVCAALASTVGATAAALARVLAARDTRRLIVLAVLAAVAITAADLYLSA